jgi:formylglycine-generating enzyme required for sulfatase activity/energy-coupling factor transporter ATP-binding protein EcfA2
MSDDKKKEISASGPRSVAAENIVAEVLHTGDVHHHYYDKEPRKPANLKEFRDDRIAEWSQPRYRLENRFVNLTLILDKGKEAQERWHRQEDFRFNDLRQALKKVEDHPVVVLLGAPGSGKSTLLRHLQLQHSEDRLNSESEEISFFIQLNGYHARPNGEFPEPAEWINSRWSARYPQLGSLDEHLQNGRVLLLLDALNEMPHGSNAQYRKLVDAWREFAQDAARQNNRLVFSCRSLNYSAGLSDNELPVPQIEVQPMDSDQVGDFLKVYAPDHEQRIWNEIDGKPQFSLYQTPFFLKLLCEQVSATGEIPKGRAALFTGFVRQVLNREIKSELFQPDTLLNDKDHKKLSLGKWLSQFELPEGGILLSKLSDLAFSMQEKGLKSEGAQVRIGSEDALRLIDDVRAKDILTAGMALNVLDEDLTQQYEIAFFHQLLQEYFAARRLGRNPDPPLVRVDWAIDKVKPALDETIAGLGGDPLPPLPQTGWEETTVIAAPIAADPQAFIRSLIPENLPLAARCAASPEVSIDKDLKREIQKALIDRTQDMKTDLRARIMAGEALGLIGDPRFVRYSGKFGDYLLPPLVDIPGGEYPIGDDNGNYEDEKPAHKVKLSSFQIGQFPVTNAEYAFFIEAGGYKDKQWWDTKEALDWLKKNKETVPEYWNDTRFNNHAQPVVGISWFEARAYCNWLTANSHGVPPSGGTESIFRLPTEAEFEAAARGKKGRRYSYGNKYDPLRCNTWDTHIRRTTPVGIFDNATPEGAYDLTGNVWEWTLSVFNDYPYKSDDGREDINKAGVSRVLRGGSWGYALDLARAVSRLSFNPVIRVNLLGFRVVLVGGPPS